MLLFKPYHIEPILEGRKTVTRRVWKRRRAVPGSLHWAQTNYNEESRFARLRILEVYEQELGLMTDEDARKEGYYETIDDFKAGWRDIAEVDAGDIYGDPWSDDREVWVVEFEVLSRFSCEKETSQEHLNVD